MAQIDKWKCDICGSTFEKDDAGYANRESLEIEINMGLYQGTEEIKYRDTCFCCREKIYNAIDKIIADLI